MNILDFSATHIAEAEKLALSNYNAERSVVTELPYIDKLPDLTPFSDNGLGVTAFDSGKMLGFLCCHNPRDHAFKSKARGIFSPIHAHGAITESRGEIYQRLYQAVSKKWVKNKIAYHSIALYAHDYEAVDAMFSYGFGLRCIDAIRPMENISDKPNETVSFCELHKSKISEIRELRRLLYEHMGCAPCFMYSTRNDLAAKIARLEERDSLTFIAKRGETLIAFIEICADGENFATSVQKMLNICGAYCLPQFRGSGIFQSLLNHAISLLRTDGYTKLGVDFESFNPTANRFWSKYFTAYTKSLVRRIDECAIRD